MWSLDKSTRRRKILRNWMASAGLAVRKRTISRQPSRMRQSRNERIAGERRPCLWRRGRRRRGIGRYRYLGGWYILTRAGKFGWKRWFDSHLQALSIWVPSVRTSEQALWFG